MEQAQQEPFLATTQNGEHGDDDDLKSVCIDWLGRPIGNDRVDLMGGWKCSACSIFGTYGLNCLAYYGILFNLVLYLVDVCGLTNAEAANTVSNFSGTLLLASFLGAFVGDTYIGRLWASLIFQILAILSYASISLAVVIISIKGSATAAPRYFLLVSLYLLAITAGPILPNSVVLGADQLNSSEEKEQYFRLLNISFAVGQLFAVTLVTYFDNMGMWPWGFGLSTASAIGTLTLIALRVRFFRQFKATGNPFIRIIQVLVAAWRKRSLPLPDDSSSLLHESQDKHSGISRLQQSSSLSFLDKAAVLGSTEVNKQSNPWHTCTVTQVEELKSLLRVIPVGIANILVYAATLSQTSTLFEEQANVMNRQVTTWLVIPAASINIFYIGSAILTGMVTTTCWCLGSRRATSLQLQGVALICSIIAMVIAALVESHRLSVAQEGALLSVLWLTPQTVLAGAANYLATVGGYDFFYNEVPNGLRTVSTSILLITHGAGNYLNSILIVIVTALTSQGGQPGWIASNLNEGHVDYFYWLLVSCLAVTLGIFLVYTHSYKYTQGTNRAEN